MSRPENVNPLLDIHADAAFMKIHELADPFTMTCIERQHALHSALIYLHRNGIKGDVVEIGVWRGGSMLIAAETLVMLGDTERTLWLFDTFDGFTEPSAVDVNWQGDPGERLYKSEYLKCSEIQVRETMALSSYPPQRIVTVCGDIRKTAKWFEGTIALLRVDCDFYDSTKAAFDHLYPHLVSGGILISDDPGHWRGAQKAQDEANLRGFIHRIDYSARIMVKP